jgi:hypothetical protein
MLNVEGGKNFLFDFKKDTVSASYISDSSLLETMTYKVVKDTLMLRKVDGQSECDPTTVGKYQFRTDKDRLYLKLISDDCLDRSSILDTTVWFRWKDHPEVYVSPSVLSKYVGVYQMTPDKPITISLEGGKLMIEGPAVDLPKTRLIPLSDTRFFLPVPGWELDFVKNPQGVTTSLISHEVQDYELKKVK